MNDPQRLSPAVFRRMGHKDRLKVFFGGLLFPSQTRQWLQFAAGNPVLRERMPLLPLALTKIYRPYLSTQLDCRRRVEILSRHYAYLCQRQLGDLVKAAALAPVTLAETICKSGEIAALELTAIHDGHREGDLCLRLLYQSELIYSASFTLLEAGGAMHLMVGRLQGACKEDSRERVREATKDLHSFRPANLLICALRHLAHQLDCRSVRLVSNRHRIALNLWRRLHITADYDRMWLEAGATRMVDGDFQINPLAAPDFDIESAPSKKRSELRKKLALTESLFSGLQQHFARPSAKPAALNGAAQGLAQRQRVESVLEPQANQLLFGREAGIAGLQPVETA